VTNQSKGKILVVRGGAIGDFILTLPALSALRKQFPDTRLEVLGYPHIAQLAKAGGLVDDVRPIEARALAAFFARNSDLSPALASYFAGFAIIISYLYDPDDLFQENIRRCSDAQFIRGPHRPDENLRRHATEVFLQPLERLAIFSTDTAPRLELAAQTAHTNGNGHATLPPGRWLAAHPGSGSDHKNWPERKWAELFPSLLAQTEINLLLIGGEAEGDKLPRLAEALPPGRVKVARNLPLAELARLLQRCQAFIGHDSGITHLAAALDLPGLVLWGYSVEHIWRPRSERLLLVREPKGLSGLPVSRVLGQLTSLIKTL